MKFITKQVVCFIIKCQTKELEYIANHYEGARYVFDMMFVSRAAYVLGILYLNKRISLSLELYKFLFYESHGLVKYLSYEEFCQELSLGVHAVLSIMEDNRMLFKKMTNSAKDRDSYDYACQTVNMSRK